MKKLRPRKTQGHSEGQPPLSQSSFFQALVFLASLHAKHNGLCRGGNSRDRGSLELPPGPGAHCCRPSLYSTALAAVCTGDCPAADRGGSADWEGQVTGPEWLSCSLGCLTGCQVPFISPLPGCSLSCGGGRAPANPTPRHSLYLQRDPGLD